MKAFFAPNIARNGRWVRAVAAMLLFTSSFFLFAWSAWAGIAAGAAGGFVLFEALRGWCILRACGVKTKL